MTKNANASPAPVTARPPAVPTGEPYRDACRAILASLDVLAIRERERCIVRAYVAVSRFRGRPCVEAGYQWARPNSHHLSGRVYECVLGRGQTFADALLNAISARARECGK